MRYYSVARLGTKSSWYNGLQGRQTMKYVNHIVTLLDEKRVVE